MNPPRIGCVPYLNARPLIHGLDGVTCEPPARLADSFRAGRYDAALIPVFEALQFNHPRLVEGCSISCRGPVLSVLIAHDTPLASVQEVSRDPDSISSNALAAVLLRHLAPAARLVEGPCRARVVIGDPALDLRKSRPDLHFTDLGAEWLRLTGLPFVFAAWCLAPAAPAQLADRLRDALAHGMEAIPQIAAASPHPDEALTYLTRHIRFPLGEPEKAGIAEFARRAAGDGLMAAPAPIEWL